MADEEDAEEDPSKVSDPAVPSPASESISPKMSKQPSEALAASKTNTIASAASKASRTEGKSVTEIKSASLASGPSVRSSKEGQVSLAEAPKSQKTPEMSQEFQLSGKKPSVDQLQEIQRSRTSRMYRQCQRRFREIIGKRELKNEELEKQQGDLKQRLNILECSMPAVMVWNIWRMSQGGSVPSLQRVLEKQFQGPASGEIYCPSTPSRHFDCRVREMEAERKQAQKRVEEARTLWAEKMTTLTEREKKLEEAKKIQEETKQRIQQLTIEAQKLRESATVAEDDGSCETGECGVIECKKKWLEKVSSTMSIKSTDLECLEKLQELAETELCMKRQIADLESREEAYMRTLQQADELWSKLDADAASTMSGLQEQLEMKTSANQQMADRICQLEDDMEKLRARLSTCRTELEKYMSVERIEALIGRDDDFAEVHEKEVLTKEQMEDKDALARPDLADVALKVEPYRDDKDTLVKEELAEKYMLARPDMVEAGLEAHPDVDHAKLGIHPDDLLREERRLEEARKYLARLGSLSDLDKYSDYICAPDFACEDQVHTETGLTEEEMAALKENRVTAEMLFDQIATPEEMELLMRDRALGTASSRTEVVEEEIKARTYADEELSVEVSKEEIDTESAVTEAEVKDEFEEFSAVEEAVVKVEDDIEMRTYAKEGSLAEALEERMVIEDVIEEGVARDELEEAEAVEAVFDIKAPVEGDVAAEDYVSEGTITEEEGKTQPAVFSEDMAGEIPDKDQVLLSLNEMLKWQGNVDLIRVTIAKCPECLVVKKDADELAEMMALYTGKEVEEVKKAYIPREVEAKEEIAPEEPTEIKPETEEQIEAPPEIEEVELPATKVPSPEVIGTEMPIDAEKVSTPETKALATMTEAPSEKVEAEVQATPVEEDVTEKLDEDTVPEAVAKLGTVEAPPEIAIKDMPVAVADEKLLEAAEPSEEVKEAPMEQVPDVEVPVVTEKPKEKEPVISPVAVEKAEEVPAEAKELPVVEEVKVKDEAPDVKEAKVEDAAKVDTEQLPVKTEEPKVMEESAPLKKEEIEVDVKEESKKEEKAEAIGEALLPKEEKVEVKVTPKKEEIGIEREEVPPSAKKEVEEKVEAIEEALPPKEEKVGVEATPMKEEIEVKREEIPPSAREEVKVKTEELPPEEEPSEEIEVKVEVLPPEEGKVSEPEEEVEVKVEVLPPEEEEIEVEEKVAEPGKELDIKVEVKEEIVDEERLLEPVEEKIEVTEEIEAVPEEEEIKVKVEVLPLKEEEEEIPLPPEEVEVKVEVLPEEEEEIVVKEEIPVPEELAALEEEEKPDVDITEVPEEKELEIELEVLPEEYEELIEEPTEEIPPKLEETVPKITLEELIKEKFRPCTCTQDVTPGPPKKFEITQTDITQTEITKYSTIQVLTQTVADVNTQTPPTQRIRRIHQPKIITITRTSDPEPEILERLARWKRPLKEQSTVTTSTISSQTEKSSLLRMLQSLRSEEAQPKFDPEQELRSIHYAGRSENAEQTECNCCVCGTIVCNLLTPNSPLELPSSSTRILSTPPSKAKSPGVDRCAHNDALCSRCKIRRLQEALKRHETLRSQDTHLLHEGQAPQEAQRLQDFLKVPQQAARKPTRDQEVNACPPLCCRRPFQRPKQTTDQSCMVKISRLRIEKTLKRSIVVDTVTVDTVPVDTVPVDTVLVDTVPVDTVSVERDQQEPAPKVEDEDSVECVCNATVGTGELGMAKKVRCACGDSD